MRAVPHAIEDAGDRRGCDPRREIRAKLRYARDDAVLFIAPSAAEGEGAGERRRCSNLSLYRAYESDD